MKFVLRSAARRDILRQFEYYLTEQDAEPTAMRFLGAVEAAIVQVCKRPGIGAPKVLENIRLNGLRSWPVKGFAEIRVYYVIAGSMVRVVRVLHGRRDIESILEEE